MTAIDLPLKFYPAVVCRWYVYTVHCIRWSISAVDFSRLIDASQRDGWRIFCVRERGACVQAVGGRYQSIMCCSAYAFVTWCERNNTHGNAVMVLHKTLLLNDGLISLLLLQPLPFLSKQNALNPNSSRKALCTNADFCCFRFQSNPALGTNN